LILNDETRALIMRKLDDGASPQQIQSAALIQLRRLLPLPLIESLSRRHGEKNQVQQAARATLATLDVSELLRAALLQVLAAANDSGEITGTHFLLLDAAERRRRELALKERLVAVAEGRLQISREDYEWRKKTLAELESKSGQGQPLSVEDLNRIREIYGLQPLEENAEFPELDPLQDHEQTPNNSDSSDPGSSL